MEINRKDIGYAVYSRLEEALRSRIREELLKHGDKWPEFIPPGVWDKAFDRSDSLSSQFSEDPADLLEETDFPDLAEIICYKNSFIQFVNECEITQREFQENMSNLYILRCKIAHVKQTFTAIDLDRLIEIAKSMLALLGRSGDELSDTLKCIETNPSSVVIKIPYDFIVDGDLSSGHIHNLPSSDYDPDGGFVGRKEDLRKIRSLIISDLDRVITICGAGGVGKTALAHKFATSIVQQKEMSFDAVVWISAKEEKLTLTGIEPIEPSFRNYEEVLDKILEVFNWGDLSEMTLKQKEENVEVILKATDKGVLLITDNLETIQDDRVIEFIKNLPRPNKVLITSRMGLGEVERRYVLKELSKKDAIAFLRIIAREKGAISLSKLPDDVLYKYVRGMSMYPLAIKWVIGQVALGKDMDTLVSNLTSSGGDVARFCFDHIFENALSETSKKVLYCLSSCDFPLTRGVLTHVSDLGSEELDNALRELTLASLVIPESDKREDQTIVTKYCLLPLTLGYLTEKLEAQPTLLRTIRERLNTARGLVEESIRASKQYRYALSDLGAITEEEKIAASLAFTAYQKSEVEDYNGAVELFKRASEIAPSFPRLYRNWAVMESSSNYYEKANELMKKATSIAPDDPSLWFTWGNIEKRRNQLEKARRHFKKAMSLSPEDKTIYGALGDVEKRFGNYDKAAKYFRKALDVPPKLKGYKHDIITYTALADNQRRWAEELRKENKYDEALEKAEEAYKIASRTLKKEQSDVRVQDTFRNVAYDLGLFHMASGDHEIAISFYKQAISDQPRRLKEGKISSRAYYQLAKIHHQIGREDDALRYYRLGERSLMNKGAKERRMYSELRQEILQRRYRGRILRILKNKGYGFIERDDIPGESVFGHISNFTNQISSNDFESMQGLSVTFYMKESVKGLEAYKVELVTDIT